MGLFESLPTRFGGEVDGALLQLDLDGFVWTHTQQLMFEFVTTLLNEFGTVPFPT